MPSSGNPLEPPRHALSSNLNDKETRTLRLEAETYAHRVVLGQLNRTSAKTVTTGVPMVVEWTSVLDSVTAEGCFTPLSNTRFTIPPARSGYWLFTLAGEWEQAVSNISRVVTSIFKNSQTEANLLARDEVSMLTGGLHSYTMSFIHKFNAGDFVMVELFHNRPGGDLQWGTPGPAGGSTFGNPYQSRFSGWYMGAAA